MIRRFLEDEKGPAEEPKLDTGDVLEDTLKHLPLDEGVIKVSQFIAGPLEVTPKGSTQFILHGYMEDLWKNRRIWISKTVLEAVL